MYQKHRTLKSRKAQVADTPQPPTPATPDSVVEQLRAIRSTIAEVQPLTPEQKKTLKALYGRMNNEILQASFNVIGASDVVQQSVGDAENARSLYDDSNRWTEVEDELRTMLSAISGANIVRRQRLALIASRAYGIGNQLARDPEHVILRPQLAEIKRLKAIARGKKQPAPTPEPPQPAPSPAEKQ